MSATGITKKYNINKTSPFEEFQIDNNKFMNSPSYIKLLKGATNITNLSSICIKNLREEQYTNNKDFCNSAVTLTDETQMHKDKTMKYMFNDDQDGNKQIGLVIEFGGVTPDLYVVYNFEIGWLTNGDTKNSFTEWLKTKSENAQICIISPDIKGWGKSKLINGLKLLSEKLEQLENITLNTGDIVLEINDEAIVSDRKTKILIKKTKSIPKVVGVSGVSTTIEQLIKLVEANQETINQLQLATKNTMEQLAALKAANQSTTLLF